MSSYHCDNNSDQKSRPAFCFKVCGIHVILNNNNIVNNKIYLKAVTGSQGQVSHCVALNSVDNFLEDTNNDVSDVISSEGCFACQMNKPPKNSRSSSSSTSIQQRNRKGKSRSSYTRRSRNYHYSSQRKILKRRTRRNTFHATFTSIRPCKLHLFSNFFCMFLNSNNFFQFEF